MPSGNPGKSTTSREKSECKDPEDLKMQISVPPTLPLPPTNALIFCCPFIFQVCKLISDSIWQTLWIGKDLSDSKSQSSLLPEGRRLNKLHVLIFGSMKARNVELFWKIPSQGAEPVFYQLMLRNMQTCKTCQALTFYRVCLPSKSVQRWEVAVLPVLSPKWCLPLGFFLGTGSLNKTQHWGLCS